jgi:predicted transposase/invertase (TIGR01784 family)
MNTNNPHDITFKEIFSDPKRARELIELSLPENVTKIFDWKTFTNEEDTFIDENLKEYFSDMLFSLKIKSGNEIKIYILFEHKSYNDKKTWIQLFSYLAKIYARLQSPAPVIPLVFYHGEKEWTLAKNFSDTLNLPKDIKEILNPYIPDFEYALLDLTKEDVENLIISLTMRAVLYTFKNIKRFDDIKYLERLIILSKDLFEQESGLKIIEKLLLYLYAASEIKPDRVKKSIVKLISEEKGDIAMTTAQRLIQEGLQQGIEQGIQQGIEKGLQKGKLEDAQKMLEESLDIHLISRITGLSIKEIEKLRKH